MKIDQSNGKKRGTASRLKAAIAVLALAGWPLGASAGTYNWQNFTGGNWSASGNWDVGTPSGTDPTTALVFGQGGTDGTYTATDDIGAAFTLNSVTLNTDISGSITLAPAAVATNTLNFAGSNAAISMTGSGSASIGNNISYTVNTTISNATAFTTLALTGAQTYAASTTTTFTGAGGISSVGAGGVPQTFGNNSTLLYTGSGTLSLGPTAHGTTGSSFAFGTSSTVNITNGVQGAGSTGTLVLNDDGTGADYTGTTVTLNFANYSSGAFNIGNMGGVSGTLNIVAGKVSFAGSTAGDLFGSSLVLNVAAGATFDFAANPESMGGITGAGNVLLTSAGATFGESGNRTFNGVFSGTGAVSQDVAAVLTLGGQNTFSGNTVIEAGGTIAVTAANVLSPNSVVNIAAGAGTLNLNGFSQSIAGLTGGGPSDTINLGLASTVLTISNTSSTNETYGGGLVGPGSLVINVGATQTLAGASTYTGTTTINAGTLRLLNGSATNALTGGAISIAGGATLDIVPPNNGSFTAPLSGTGTLITEGPGTVTFSTPNPAFTPTSVQVLGGGLVLDDSTDATATQIGSPALTISSATVTINGNIATPVTHNFNGVTVAGGVNINVNSGNGTTPVTVNLGGLTRLSGGTINFLPSNAAVINTTTGNDPAGNGIIGDYATINSTDWATASGAGPNFNIVPFTNYIFDTWAPGNHTDIASSNTYSTPQTTYDLRFNLPVSATITLPTGTNTLTGGGILVTANVGTGFASTVTGGTLAVPAGKDLILSQFNTGANLNIGSIIPNAATTFTLGNVLIGGGTNHYQTVTVPSTASLAVGDTFTATSQTGNTNTPIAGSWNGHIVAINSPTSFTIAYLIPTTTPATTLSSDTYNLSVASNTNVVKTGPGTASLTASNTFQGAVIVSQGTMSIGALATAGAQFSATAAPYFSSSIYLNGGTLDFTAGNSPGSNNQPLTIGPAGGTIQVDGTNTFSRTGDGLFGSGTIIKTGTGSMNVGSDNTSYSGLIIVNNGALKQTSNQLVNATMVVNNGGQYQINDNNGAATYNFATGSVLILNGNGPTFGTNTTPGAYAETLQGSGTSGPTTTITNAVQLASDSRFGDYSGTFAVATIFSGVISGPGALIKDGTGPLTLSAVNTYGTAPNSAAATTVISEGTLVLGATNALPSGSSLQFGESITGNTISSNHSGTLDMGGKSQTLGSITIATNVTAAQSIINSSTTASTLTVSYASTATPDSFAGQIGGGTLAAPTTASIALAKTGAGTLILTGANTLSGAITVTGGGLYADNTSGSATGSGAITVKTGTTLGGSGILGLSGSTDSAISVNSGGLIAAGANSTTTGQLTSLSTKGVTLSGGSGYIWKIGSGSGVAGTATGFDLLSTQGLTFSTLSATSLFTVHVTGAPASLPAGTTNYLIATDPVGPISINGSTFANGMVLTTSNFFALDTSGFTSPPGVAETFTLVLAQDAQGTSGQDLVLVGSNSVPEPGAATLVLCSAGSLLLRRRRKISKSMSS